MSTSDVTSSVVFVGGSLVLLPLLLLVVEVVLVLVLVRVLVELLLLLLLLLCLMGWDLSGKRYRYRLQVADERALNFFGTLLQSYAASRPL